MFFAPEAEASCVAARPVSLSLYAVFTALTYWSARVQGLMADLIFHC